jgi:hypothetical protein
MNEEFLSIVFMHHKHEMEWMVLTFVVSTEFVVVIERWNSRAFGNLGA